MNGDAVPSGNALTGSPVPFQNYNRRTYNYNRRAALLTLGGIYLVFVLWTAGVTYLLDHNFHAQAADQRGVWLLIVLGLGCLAVTLARDAYSDILTLKSWLERGLYTAALLLAIVFASAVGIGAADKHLSTNHMAVLIAIAFCFGSLSMTALVWWISLSPTNPLRMREAQRKSLYIGDAIEPRRLDEMTGHGIPLIVATALLVSPPLAALTFIALDWQYASQQVFIYPAGVLPIPGALILFCVAAVRAWLRGRKHDAKQG